MKYIFSLVCFLFSVNVFAQVDSPEMSIPWQGYVNTGATEVRASFYLAGEDFDPTTVFNDRNYPFWYLENIVLQVEDGVVHTVLEGISKDSLHVRVSGRVWLYVTVNGQSFDKVRLYPTPWSVWSENALYADEANKSDFATDAIWADTAQWAHDAGHSLTSDTAVYAENAGHSVSSDFSDSSMHANSADSSLHATHASRASFSDNSQFALLADSALKADSATWAAYAERANLASTALTAQIATLAIMADSLRDNKVNSSTIIDSTIQREDLSAGIIDNSAMAENSVTTDNIQDGTVAFSDMNITGTATNNSVVGYNNGSLVWVSNNNILVGSVQQTTVIPTQINQDARWVILQVAQDFNLVGMTANEGRIITIVNASTANVVTLATTNWNIYGGNLSIFPRSSRTIAYLNGEWIVLQ
jgi:hypothetical protein